VELGVNVLDLLVDQPIFIGFKLDTSLRRQLEAIAGPDRKYVSAEDSTFLRICRVGEHQYVGKLIHERLTTDRVDDIRRSIFSILQRLCPETRFPHELEIVACSGEPDGSRPPDREAW
jgi:hypothetical protein